VVVSTSSGVCRRPAVDDRGDVLGVVALVAHVAAEERLAVALAELDRTELLGHAVLR
jgi:hypothetical protein